MTTLSDDFDSRAAELEQEVRAALVRAYDGTAARIDIDALADAIAAQDDIAIADALNMDEGLLSVLNHELGAGLFYVLLGGMILAMKAFATSYSSRVDTTSHVPRLRDEIRRNVITALARRGRDAALETIRVLSDARVSPREIAIAVRQNISLSPAQAKSAAYFQRSLLAALNHPKAIITANGVTIPAHVRKSIRDLANHSLNAAQRSVLAKALASELTDKEVKRLVDRHARALTDYRQRVIASQEAVRAIHAGEYLAFRQGRANRSLHREARRFWRTAGDERVRYDHAAIPSMNVSGVDVGQPFQTPLGPVVYPPLEVNCRCRVEVRWPRTG